MKELDGDGPGCMFYPYDPKGTCRTNPLVTMHKIYMKNIKIHRALVLPIIIKCNATNPCSDIHFDEVQVDSWRIGNKKTGYVCEEASGTITNSTPEVECLKDASHKQIFEFGVKQKKKN